MNTTVTKKKAKPGHLPKFNVTLRDLTQGQLMALKHALEHYTQFSPVCGDIKQSLAFQLNEKNIELS